MYTIYVYVLDNLADWELGHVALRAELRPLFQKGCAARDPQNGELFQGAGHYHGRDENCA